MQSVTTIVDSKDGRHLLSVDGCTLNAIFEAITVTSEPRLYELVCAIRSYQEYKRAQATVAAYEMPARSQAIRETFLGKGKTPSR